MPTRPTNAFASPLIRACLCAIALWLSQAVHAQEQTPPGKEPSYSEFKSPQLEGKSPQLEAKSPQQEKTQNRSTQAKDKKPLAKNNSDKPQGQPLRHEDTKEQRDNNAQHTSKEAPKEAPKELGKTIWLEEKLNPGTQWLENAVKPLTRWIEGQVQLKAKEKAPQTSQKASTPLSNRQPERPGEPIETSDLDVLSKEDIRELLKQRYSANVLHIKALGNGAAKQYRIKMINQQGVIQILYLRAADGQEVSR